MRPTKHLKAPFTRAWYGAGVALTSTGGLPYKPRDFGRGAPRRSGDRARGQSPERRASEATVDISVVDMERVDMERPAENDR
jgi:hypothetical protein